MAVGSGGINIQRGGVEIWWDPGDTDPNEAVLIKAENAENGDVGIVHDRNDGFHVLTYPPGTYNDHITVTEVEDGDLIAEFDISVKVSR